MAKESAREDRCDREIRDARADHPSGTGWIALTSSAFSTKPMRSNFALAGVLSVSIRLGPGSFVIQVPRVPILSSTMKSEE